MRSERLHIPRFGTIPNSIGPWSLHMSRPHICPDLSLDQILGTVYKTKVGSDRKDLVWTKLVL